MKSCKRPETRLHIRHECDLHLFNQKQEAAVPHVISHVSVNSSLIVWFSDNVQRWTSSLSRRGPDIHDLILCPLSSTWTNQSLRLVSLCYNVKLRGAYSLIWSSISSIMSDTACLTAANCSSLSQYWINSKSQCWINMESFLSLWVTYHRNVEIFHLMCSSLECFSWWRWRDINT